MILAGDMDARLGRTSSNEGYAGDPSDFDYHRSEIGERLLALRADNLLFLFSAGLRRWNWRNGTWCHPAGVSRRSESNESLLGTIGGTIYKTASHTGALASSSSKLQHALSCPNALVGAQNDWRTFGAFGTTYLIRFAYRLLRYTA